MQDPWLWALFGGVLVGLSASMMLVGNGRVTGISGIVSNALTQTIAPKNWRVVFVLGLLVGGVLLRIFFPETLNSQQEISDLKVIVAGLLVGFGTTMGSGCTSGHGVCGLSRLSPRSAVATGTFILVGVVTVLFLRLLGAK